jgi:hypothetical protein
MTYSKELHDRVRENLHMFDYPRFDDGDIHGLLDEIERLQKLVDAKQNRCAELESRLDLYHGNMYDVVCQENDRLNAANEWVSVKEALPAEQIKVLVYGKGEFMLNSIQDGRWYLHMDVITHWQEPTPPTGGENE